MVSKWNLSSQTSPEDELRSAGTKKINEDFDKAHLYMELEDTMKSLDDDITDGTVGNTLIPSLTYCNRCNNAMTGSDYNKFIKEIIFDTFTAYCAKCIKHVHKRMRQALSNAVNDYDENESDSENESETNVASNLNIALGNNSETDSED